MQKRQNMQRVITEEIKLLMGVKVFIKQFLHISLAKAMKLDLDMQWASNVKEAVYLQM